MIKKHAYLIIAHNDFDVLEKQLLLLDDYRNDFYIHIDKKVKNFDFNYYKSIVKKSTISYTKRLSISWGDFSLVQCELLLLKSSIKNKYEYYHLISGVDLPLKTNDEIHNFFSINANQEFVHFATNTQTEYVKDRILFYHFMKFERNPNKYISLTSRKLNSLSLKIQSLFNIKRRGNKNIKLKYGAQWFSITHGLANYVISKESWINSTFKYTLCSDELFLQTLLYNSHFVNNLYLQNANDDYTACLRFIDWTRGNPYTFKNTDFEELINSKQLFARKFSTKFDNEIINDLFNYLKK